MFPLDNFDVSTSTKITEFLPNAATAASKPSFSSVGSRAEFCTHRLGGLELLPLTGQTTGNRSNEEAHD